MNGYVKIRVMANGRYADCWQQIEAGKVVAHVNDDGRPIALPEPHEAVCLTGQMHFAPNVLDDPALLPAVAILPLFAEVEAPANPVAEG